MATTRYNLRRFRLVPLACHVPLQGTILLLIRGKSSNQRIESKRAPIFALDSPQSDPRYRRFRLTQVRLVF